MTNEETIKEFVRDICAVGWHPKSRVRRRLDDILKAQRKDLLEKIEGIDKVKFPRGERKWCIECAKRIKKQLLK